MNNVNMVRESSFELIRILAQFFIVFYHIFSFFVYPTTDVPLHKAIWLPLHIGVILFVLISGYFGIKASIKGFIKLTGMMAVLYIPLAIANYLIIGGVDKHDIVSFVLFVSATPFWFMRTYVFLYLFSPIINLYMQNITLLRRIYLIGILFFMSHYIGTLGTDVSLLDGKNLTTFLFLYVIGNTLFVYKQKWQTISPKWYGLMFVMLNVALIAIFSYTNGKLADFIFTRFFFSYCSVGLLISSILFFMCVGGLSFKSKIINYMAKSSLVIYMVHGASLIFFHLIKSVVDRILIFTENEFELFLSVFILSTIIVFSCIILNMLLTPIWRIIDRVGGYIQNKTKEVLNNRGYYW